jgi:hypothetical protein
MADALVFDHHLSEKITIRIDPASPAISYFPSGLGILDPFFVLIEVMFSLAVIVAILYRFLIVPVMQYL